LVTNEADSRRAAGLPGAALLEHRQDHSAHEAVEWTVTARSVIGRILRGDDDR